MSKTKFIELNNFPKFPTDEMINRSKEFANYLKRRRTVREFAEDSVPIEVIKNCVEAAASVPSGANMQPWHFVIVKDPKTKKKIREGAEKEEREFYGGRAPDEWLEALEKFDTNENKPFLETAPYLIVIFEQKYHLGEAGKKIKHYYVKESVGIAVGTLITALHNAGLASLTHTPSPMNFLNEILNRPENEKPFLILVTGYPKEGTKVPKIEKKKFSEVCTIV
ncbi:MAG: nitroreductase family protein [Melioribacteraceae bacterium]|nr:nitroreductase family protein [Melioribacteraceae bacterium]